MTSHVPWTGRDHAHCNKSPFPLQVMGLAAVRRCAMPADTSSTDWSGVHWSLTLEPPGLTETASMDAPSSEGGNLHSSPKWVRRVWSLERQGLPESSLMSHACKSGQFLLSHFRPSFHLLQSFWPPRTIETVLRWSFLISLGRLGSFGCSNGSGGRFFEGGSTTRCNDEDRHSRWVSCNAIFRDWCPDHPRLI